MESDTSRPGSEAAREALVLAATFALSFASQRQSGMVTRLTRPPAHPLRAWIAFIAIVILGPRASALWQLVR